MIDLFCTFCRNTLSSVHYHLLNTIDSKTYRCTKCRRATIAYYIETNSCNPSQIVNIWFSSNLVILKTLAVSLGNFNNIEYEVRKLVKSLIKENDKYKEKDIYDIGRINKLPVTYETSLSVIKFLLERKVIYIYAIFRRL